MGVDMNVQLCAQRNLTGKQQKKTEQFVTDQT